MLSLSKKVLILVTVPVVFEVGLVSVVGSLLVKVEEARVKAAHARDLSSRFNRILVAHFRRVSLMMVRKYQADSNPEISPEEEELTRQVQAGLKDLRDACARNPSDNKGWKEISTIMDKVDGVFTRATDNYFSGDTVQASLTWATAQNDLAKAFRLASQIANEDSQTERLNEADYDRNRMLLETVLKFSIPASVFVAFGLALYFNQGTSSRLRKLMANTTLLAMGKAPRDTVGGSDELAEIDRLYHVMHADLNTLRQRERAILDNAGEIICSIDDDLKIVDINNAATILWGYESDQLLGRRVLDLVAETQKSTAQKVFDEAMKGKGSSRCELSIRTAGGGTAETLWSLTWSPEERALYCVVSDISERKRLDQMKREFVAMISHDLRTPLTSTLSSLELVCSPHISISPEARVYIEKAQNNLQVTLALINQLLEMERMESGVVHLDYDATSTKELVTRAVAVVSGIAEKRKIEIKVPATNYDLVADADKLVQVLVNLLGNALKFSPEQSKITISEELRGAAGERLRISVTDRGRGIPPDKLAKIFDRFEQADPSAAAEKAGSGLGLAICKAIVEAHHGTIGVISDAQFGSTFWLEIPRET